MDIEQCIDMYRRSIEKADVSLAAEVWAETPEVSLIHPRGHEHGWEAVKANFYEKVMGTLFSERRLDVHDVRVHPYPEAAVAEFYWDFTATVRADGSARRTQGRESLAAGPRPLFRSRSLGHISKVHTFFFLFRHIDSKRLPDVNGLPSHHNSVKE